ncbi:MAG: hypothetical protein AB1491_09455 [Thermodesulfobacteriota bacterium]
MITEAIESIADKLLAVDDAELKKLLHHFKNRMYQGEPTRSWERAVLGYFLVNGIRVKNALKRGKLQRQKLRSHSPPSLKLVKA